MKKILVGFLSVSLALLAGCSKMSSSGVKDNSKVIIKVNNSPITQSTFDKVFKSALSRTFPGKSDADIKDPKNRFVYLIYQDKIINELIIRELLKQEIAKRKITVTDKEVNDQISNIANNLGGKAKLEAALTLNNVTYADFTDNIKTDLLTKKLIESLTPGNSVSDSQVEKFYNENKATKFTYQDMVRAQHILVSFNEADVKARIEAENPKITPQGLDKKVQEELAKTQKKADNILAEVKAKPAAFSELAKKYSEDLSSAQNGGDLGFFSKKDMIPEFSKVAFNTTPGQISNIVKTQFGYHIIKVLDRKKAGITPLVEVKAEIKQYLDAQHKMKILQKLIEGLRNTANISYLDKQYDPKVLQNEVQQLVKSKKIQVPVINTAEKQGK